MHYISGKLLEQPGMELGEKIANKNAVESLIWKIWSSLDWLSENCMEEHFCRCVDMERNYDSAAESDGPNKIATELHPWIFHLQAGGEAKYQLLSITNFEMDVDYL